MASTSRWRIALVVTVLLVSLSGAAPAAQSAQDSPIGTITVRGFACPPGMTAATLDPDACVPSVLRGVTLSADDGLDQTLTLGDAVYDGAAYMWDGLPVPTEGTRTYRLSVTELLTRFTDFVAQGDRVAMADDGTVATTLSVDEPTANVAIYQFVPGPAMRSLVVVPLACPSATAKRSECEALEGVEIEVEIDGQSVEGSPFTSAYSVDFGTSVIYFQAPTDASLTLTEVDGLPEGYGPASGFDPLTIAVANFEQGPPGGGDSPAWYAYIVNVPVSAGAETATPVARPGWLARVQAGTCDRFSQEPSWELTDLAVPDGSVEGSAPKVGVASSSSVVPASLDELLATPYAIWVERDQGIQLVCGAIGGVRAPDGLLAIGLREVDASGYSGVALLVPDAENSARTRVSVFLVQTRPDAAGSAQEGEPAATPVAE